MAYCMPCNVRATRREGVGPTGKKQWMVLVDTCHRCGRHYAFRPNKLTLEQRSWLKRINTLAGKKDDTERTIDGPSTDTSAVGNPWPLGTNSW